MDQETNTVVIKDNKDIVCYFITKHSWRGKLVSRVFMTVDHEGSFLSVHPEFIGNHLAVCVLNSDLILWSFKKKTLKFKPPTFVLNYQHRCAIFADTSVYSP